MMEPSVAATTALQSRGIAPDSLGVAASPDRTAGANRSTKSPVEPPESSARPGSRALSKSAAARPARIFCTIKILATTRSGLPRRRSGPAVARAIACRSNRREREDEVDPHARARVARAVRRSASGTLRRCRPGSASPSRRSDVSDRARLRGGSRPRVTSTLRVSRGSP